VNQTNALNIIENKGHSRHTLAIYCHFGNYGILTYLDMSIMRYEYIGLRPFAGRWVHE